MDIGARCGNIYKPEEAKKALNRGFNFFANPLYFWCNMLL
jgi:hypothetical protein